MKRMLFFLLLCTLVLSACATQSAAPTAAVQPTPTDASAALIAMAEDWPDYLTDSITYSSPDESWNAEVVNKHDLPGKNGVAYYLAEMIVTNAEGTLTWHVGEILNPMGLGDTLPFPVRWSVDDTQLYFVQQGYADGCSLFPFHTSLSVVNLGTGAVTPMFEQMFGEISVSQDGGTIVYLRNSEDTHVLHIIDPLTLETATLTLELSNIDQAGSIVWSPDGDAFAFTAAQAPCSADWQHAIVIVDIASGTQRVVLPLGPERYFTRGWTAEGILILDPNLPNPPQLLDPDAGALRPES